MKISHLEAVTKVLGYSSLESYLVNRYSLEGKPLDEIAFELDVGVRTVNNLVKEFRISKAIRKIPLTPKDAKRLDLNTIAKIHGVSRATAWRWKCAILRTEKAVAKLEDSTELDVPGLSIGDEDVPPSTTD
jgi:hypothetical protein